jgi:hypothetical protein
LRSVANSDLRAVLIEGDIPDPVQSVFNGPMATDQLEEANGVRLLRGEAGDAVDDFVVLFVGEGVGDVAINTKDLGDMGEADIVVEFGAGEDRALFEATMGFLDGDVLRGGNRRG